MKSLRTLLLLCAFVLSPFAHSGDPIVEISTSSSFNETAQINPNDTILYGSVYVSGAGNLKVLWDGVSINLGSYGANTDGTRNYYAVTLPSVILDLQKIFGVNWMKSLNITLNPYGYDDSPIRNTEDTYLGKLMINLSQSILSEGALKWEVTEGTGMAAHSTRHYYTTGKTAESIPFFFTLGSKVSDKLSQDLVVALSVGAYATLMDKLNGPDENRYGGFISPSISLGKSITAGLRYEQMQRLIFNTSTVYQNYQAMTGFVKYVLSSMSAGSSMNQAIQINFGKIYDETIPVQGGKPAKTTYVGMQYIVGF